jgi:hypothetical protein
VEPEPRPPDLLPEPALLEPLGAEVVRVAILATVPEQHRFPGDLEPGNPPESSGPVRAG